MRWPVEFRINGKPLSVPQMLRLDEIGEQFPMSAGSCKIFLDIYILAKNIDDKPLQKSPNFIKRNGYVFLRACHFVFE